MADAVKTAAKPSTPALSLFDKLKAEAVQVSAPVIYTDKQDLVGKPFIITEWVRADSKGAVRNVQYAEVSYMLEDGTKGVFRDASQYGVRSQLFALPEGGKPEAGTIYDAPILVPEGLIVREFTTDVEDGNNKGKTKEIKSRVYQLSGK